MMWLMIGSLLVLIVAGVPIAIAIAVTTIAYFYLAGIPIEVMAGQMMQGANSFVLTALPLFILAGLLLNESGITERLIRFANSVLGTFRGGLAQVNIATSTVFAGVSGDAVSDTAALGTVMVPAMEKQGYPREFSAAVTVGSAVAGPILPPSLPMIVTGSLAGVSIGQLFLGGAVPGILFVIAMSVYVMIVSRFRDYPRGRERGSMNFRQASAEIGQSFRAAFWGLLAPVVVIGGLVIGFVTATEAAAVAVIYVLFIGLVVYRGLTWRIIVKQASLTVMTTGSIMFILAVASPYTNALTREGVAATLASATTGVTENPRLVLLLLIGVGLLAGAVLSTTPGLLLLIPILAPLIRTVELDPIHAYVLLTVALSVGTLTPPVGLNLYLIGQIADLPPERVFIAVLPFIALLLGVVGLAVYFPEIVLWLPRVAG